MKFTEASLIGAVTFLGLAALVGVYGCSPEQKYRVLTFFFDGVPPLGGVSPDAASGSDSKRGAKRRPQPVRVFIVKPHKEFKCSKCHYLSRGVTLRKDRTQLCATCHSETFQDRKFVHGPVSVIQCGACHSAHNSKFPAATLKPVPDLCVGCHARPGLMEEPYHVDAPSPVCVACHDPHGADNRFFLREGDAAASQPTTQPERSE